MQQRNLSEVKADCRKRQRMPRYRHAWIRKDLPIRWDRSFYLSGAVGSGKTHAVMGLRHWSTVRFYLYQKGSSVLVSNVPRLMQELRYCELDTRGERLEYITEAPFLVLDDMGAEHRTEFSEDALLQIMDWRYNNLKPTGFTSNLPLEKLPYDDRLVSRIAGMVKQNRHELKGPDRRV